jgi:patatin-like phospholipase/acyl hydrolase
MTPNSSPRFQILALSGGGFRGAFTAKILADIERDLGDKRIANYFDLIAGTSIGGILALALALEIPAARMVEFFKEHGDEIFGWRLSMAGILRSFYSPTPLQRLLEQPDLFGDKLLGACKHPVMVPSINYSQGEPVLFKTPHHVEHRRDHLYRIVDIAMATSAAPSYFPRHRFNDCQYVDGGLYANAPGMLALHEAEIFFGQRHTDVWLASIGTMSSKFTVNPKQGKRGGAMDWGRNRFWNMPKRLFGLSISVQETLAKKMLEHKLGQRSLHIDEIPSDERAEVIALDNTSRYAKEALFGAASETSKAWLSKPAFRTFLAHSPAKPVFHHGENKTL